MRHVVGERAKDKTAASVSLMGRFEIEILTQPKNMELLKNLSGQWVFDRELDRVLANGDHKMGRGRPRGK